MADVDAKLAASLKQAKTSTMFFVFVAKGNEGKLLVDKKKISPKDAAEAKKECGGGTIYKGRCRGEGGTLVFEVGKEVPPSLPTLTKKIIKQDAALTFDVEYRVAPDLAAEEGQGEAAAEGATPPAAVAPPAPPAPPGPQPAQAAQGGAEVTKRLNAMSASIKTALAGPNKPRVQALFVSVSGLIKNKDFAAAGAALDELEPLVAKPTGAPAAAGAAVPPAPPRAAAPPPPTAPANDAALAAEWERRVIALEPKVLDAQKTRAGEAKWMTMFMSAQDLGSDGDYAKSLAILDKLEGMLSAPAKASAAQPAKGAASGPISNVALQQSLHAWDAARKKTHSELQALERQILELFSDDPRLAEVKQSTRKLDAVLGDYAEELRDWLDDAYNAPVEKKPAICTKAVTVLKRYRAYLSKDPFVKAVAANVLQPIDIEGTLGKTLDDVAKTLGA